MNGYPKTIRGKLKVQEITRCMAGLRNTATCASLPLGKMHSQAFLQEVFWPHMYGYAHYARLAMCSFNFLVIMQGRA